MPPQFYNPYTQGNFQLPQQRMVTWDEYAAVTGQLQAIQQQQGIESGETVDPLAQRELPRPNRSLMDTGPQRTIKPLPVRPQPKEEMTLAQLATEAKEGVNSAMKRVNGAMKRGRRAKALAPGSANETMNESGLESDPSPEPADEIAESDMDEPADRGKISPD